MIWGFCVYFVYMIPLETDVLRNIVSKNWWKGETTLIVVFIFFTIFQKSHQNKKTSTVTHIFYSIIRFFMKISL